MLCDLAKAGESPAAIRAPVCIVGAGLAGLIAAARIADAGTDVIVLESGQAQPDSRFDALNEIVHVAGNYRHAVTGRARALGGTSTAWGGRMMPLTPHDLGARDYIGLDAWPLAKAELDGQTAFIETLFGLDRTSYASDFPTPYAVEALGPASVHMHSRWAKWPSFRRRNIAKNLESRIAADKTLTVWLNATVCGFDLDADRGLVRGLKVRSACGRSMAVSAAQVILACGTLETTRLLLLLDRHSGGRAHGDCGVLGRYFNDHLALEIGQIRPPIAALTNRVFGYHIGGRTRRSLHLETTAHAQQQDGAASGFVTVRPEFRQGSLHHYIRNAGLSEQAGGRARHSPGQLMRTAMTVPAALFWRGVYRQMYFGPNVDLFVDARIEQVGCFDSRLTLSETPDQFGVPRLALDWRKTSTDEHTFRSVVRRAQLLWNETPLGRTCPVDWGYDPANETINFCHGSRDTRHPAGSARMGLNRATSVVDPSLRCHAVRNLLVASAAVFPSSGSANPTLTIMQLASIAAASALAGDQHDRTVTLNDRARHPASELV